MMMRSTTSMRSTTVLLSLLAFARAADEACTAVGRALSPDEQRTYAEEGYVIVRSMFSAEEVAVLIRTIESDPSIDANVMPMVDASGRTSKVTLWNRAGNNTYGHFARGRRWVGAATALIGEAPYHFHTKVMLKEPLAGGQWEWHQDFGCTPQPQPAWHLCTRDNCACGRQTGTRRASTSLTA